MASRNLQEKPAAMEAIPIDRQLGNAYQEKWESRSSVRTRPRKWIDFSQEGYFFPEEKQPLLLRQEIMGLGQRAKEKILLQSFLKYLNDIVSLETRLINSACYKLIDGHSGLHYNDDIKLGAYTVLIDEHYHVYVAQDMSLQLLSQFPELGRFDYPVSDAHYAVALIRQRMEAKYHDAFEVLAVCIFETTLVRELIEFFNSANVHPSIKYYVNDHMNDEARHYGFFYEILTDTWKRLPDDYQEAIGSHLADFIKQYLNVQSDKRFYADLLNRLLQDAKQSSAIVEDLYKGFEISPDIPMVKNVLSVLKKAGVLDNRHVKAGFQAMGWTL
ncbi:diiron oxygenase [Candidatus Glomeribacter gigasporarum]|nr:diiron oxygenase [Candidatus Glomeribacter gigasporarum]